MPSVFQNSRLESCHLQNNVGLSIRSSLTEVHLSHQGPLRTSTGRQRRPRPSRTRKMPQSIQFLAPEPINLVNNEPSSDEVTGSSLHFKNITVGSCTIVNSQNNKFSVWQLEVTLSPTGTSGAGSPHIRVYKRYTDFELFREKLLRSLTPALRPCVPQLPPKVSWYESWHYGQANFKSSWLARRRAGLEYFLNQVLLNDKVLTEALPCVKEFLEK